MSKLNDYVDKIKEYQSQNPNISELELIRYVYLDLGKRFSFNYNFIPFGNSRNRQKIYRKSRSKLEWEECMEKNIVICNSVAHILEYVLKAVGINIRTEPEKLDFRKTPHVYNVITPKMGEPYVVDLQEDIYNIQSHSFTRNFGLSIKNREKLVVPRLKQELIDRKLGYIDDKNYYADDYLYLLKYTVDAIEDFSEKVKFALENIEVYDNLKMQYTDRKWHHALILEELFTDKDFNFADNNRRIRMIDCYKDIKGERKFIQCVSIHTKRGTEIYVYNSKQCRYVQADFKEFAKAVNNGLVVHNCKVPGLNRMCRSLKEEGR